MRRCNLVELIVNTIYTRCSGANCDKFLADPLLYRVHRNHQFWNVHNDLIQEDSIHTVAFEIIGMHNFIANLNRIDSISIEKDIESNE